MTRAAIVTGAAGGIGRSIAHCLADRGFALVLTDLAFGDLGEVLLSEFRTRGVPFEVVLGDVDDDEVHAQLIDAPKRLDASLGVLVNNAGVSSTVRGDPLDLPAESLDRALKVNLRAPFRLSQKVAKAMLAEGGDDIRCIVNVTSVNAAIIGMNRPDYCITKAGLSMLSSILAARLAGDAIQVHEVRPGITETEMTAPSREKYNSLMEDGTVPMRRWGRPEDVGRTIAALATGALPFTTGGAINVDGGLHMYRI